MILMYKNKERYYPLFFRKSNKKNITEQKYIIDTTYVYKWKLYMKYIQSSIIKFRFPSKLNIKLYSLKITQLIELAKEYDIPTEKLSTNKKKITNKTKDELKDDIRKKLGLTL